MRYGCSEVHRHISKLICIGTEEKFLDINVATLMCIAVLYRSHVSICLLLSYTMEISTSRLNIPCSQDLKEYSTFLYHTQSNHCHIIYTFSEDAELNGSAGKQDMA